MNFEPVINLVILILLIWFSSLLLLGVSGFRYYLDEKLDFVNNDFVNDLSEQLNIHKSHIIFFCCMLFISLWLLYFGIIDGCNLLVIITVIIIKFDSEINNKDFDKILKYIVMVVMIWAFEILCQVNYNNSIFVITKILILISLYMNNFRLLEDIINVICNFYKNQSNDNSVYLDSNIDDL